MSFTRISVNSYRPRVTHVRPSDIPSTFKSSNNSNPAFASPRSTQMKPIQRNRYGDTEDPWKGTMRNSNVKKTFQMKCSYGQLACCFCLAITLALLVSTVIGTVLAIVLPHTTTLSTTATTATTTTATKSSGRSDLMLCLTRTSAGLYFQLQQRQQVSLPAPLQPRQQVQHQHQPQRHPLQPRQQVLRPPVRPHQQVPQPARPRQQVLQQQVWMQTYFEYMIEDLSIDRDRTWRNLMILLRVVRV
ncbi:unnamed protein product, partial [Adineta steineri]